MRRAARTARRRAASHGPGRPRERHQKKEGRVDRRKASAAPLDRDQQRDSGEPGTEREARAGAGLAAAGHEPGQDRDEERDRGRAQGRHPRRHELLLARQEAVAGDEEEQTEQRTSAQLARGRPRRPRLPQPPQADEDRPAAQAAQAHHAVRRDGLDRVPDREERRAPHEVDRRERGDRGQGVAVGHGPEPSRTPGAALPSLSGRETPRRTPPSRSGQPRRPRPRSTRS